MQEIRTATRPTTSNPPSSTFTKKPRPVTDRAKTIAPAYVEGQGRLSFKTIPFFLMHLACIASFFVDFSLTAVLLCVAMYAIRMFGLTAGFHRYFAHRAYKTSRAVQFLLAVLGTAALQKGPLWWAAHHRRHHKYTDQEGDLHSPVKDGFWWSHLGWVISRKYEPTDWNAIKDFSRFPELRWLNSNHWIPGVAVAVLCFFGGVLFGASGWSWLVWGFFVSTVLLYHGTFTVNSLAHMWGSRRYPTTDDSRNNFWIALWTGGEGWHNNHHHYMASVKQGFFWWEIDFSYYALRVMSWFRLVWDLRLPPKHLLTAARSS